MSPHVPASTPAAVPAVRPALVLLGVLALAVNLRAALAAYPPLLETVRDELGISSGAAGLVQAGAVLMMAAGSFVGPALGARFGRKPALGGAVGLVALGSAVRGWAVLPALIGGSLLLGLGIGVAGVLLTGVVKNHLGSRAGAATGGYVVAMMIGATVSSAVDRAGRRRAGRLVVLPRDLDRARGARGGGLDADRASHRPAGSRRGAQRPALADRLRAARGRLPGRDVADVLRLADVARAVLRGPGLASGAGRSAARGVERRPDPGGAARPGDGRAAPEMAVLGGSHARVRVGRHARRAAPAPAPGRRPVAVGRADGDRRRRRLPARPDGHRLAHPGRQHERGDERAGPRSRVHRRRARPAADGIADRRHRAIRPRSWCSSSPGRCRGSRSGGSATAPPGRARPGTATVPQRSRAGRRSA